mgnify:CR=1 FL=1
MHLKKCYQVHQPFFLLLVFKLEKKVNTAEVEIDSLCNHTLALRQPTATDLRFIVSSQRMIRDLERIGDEAEKMARMMSAQSKKLEESN